VSVNETMAHLCIEAQKYAEAEGAKDCAFSGCLDKGGPLAGLTEEQKQSVRDGLKLYAGTGAVRAIQWLKREGKL
jgi:hypothetical protein